ncbi:hypothetical protein CW749_02075 [Vibrio sp. vnigr-6D03]|uniref:hypothetical protein n=1 Tax=Vibrio sp. vnigr-6D03 TaxID=2058088 RepID=UPI000C34A447|nr:hypothetical protein [Vibrio sp. vnigr-6D03]PKF81449.1 hypothetical protein CW749_02075 [Vibrio sp. vnigr-6D03]
MISIRYDASAIYSGTKSVGLGIGGVNTRLSSTTAAKDTTPRPFSFGRQSGVDLSTTITSAPITVGGINAPSPISIAAGQYSINNGPFITTPSTVEAGDEVQVRHTSSALHNASTLTTLTIGGVSSTFVSGTKAATTTADTTPDAFTLGTLTDVDLNTLVVSSSVTVSGINAPADISIVDGEYSINGGTFTSADGSVSVNDEVVVRHTSASNAASLQTSTLTIGGESAVFSTTTKAISSNTGTVSGASSSGASFGLGWLLFAFLIGLRRVKK